MSKPKKTKNPERKSKDEPEEKTRQTKIGEQQETRETADEQEKKLPWLNNIYIQPTDYCSPGCYHCMYREGASEKRELSSDELKKIIELYSFLNPIAYIETIHEGPIYLEFHPKTHIHNPQLTITYDGGFKTLENVERPRVYIIGGGFSFWPREMGSRVPSREQRLLLQAELLEFCRELLPHHTIVIATNGIFANDKLNARRVLRIWRDAAGSRESSRSGGLKLQIDPSILHRTENREEASRLIRNLRDVCDEYEIELEEHLVDLNSGEGGLDSDEHIALEGCPRELRKNFLLGNELHDIVIKANGDAVYCTGGSGRFGHILTEPERTLKAIAEDPLAEHLRSAEGMKKIKEIIDDSHPHLVGSEYMNCYTCKKVMQHPRITILLRENLR